MFAFYRTCSHVCPRSFDRVARTLMDGLRLSLLCASLPICIFPIPMHVPYVLLVVLCNFLSFAFCTSNSYSICRATLLALELCMLYPHQNAASPDTAHEPAYHFLPLLSSALHIHSGFSHCRVESKSLRALFRIPATLRTFVSIHD